MAAPEPAPGGEVLSAWLHLTNACNLSCPYCYVHKDARALTLETGRKAIDALFSSAIQGSFPKIQLKYAGGEPALQFSLLMDLHARAKSLAIRHGIALEGVMLTNGAALTDEMITWLAADGMTVSLSMDGLGQYHDIQRPAGTKGSYQRVAQALDRMLELGCRPEITVTLSTRNLAGLPEMVRFLLRRELHFSLNFYRETSFTAQQADLSFDNAAVIAALQEVFREIEANLPRYSLLGALIDRTNLAAAHPYPCDAGLAYLVIDTDGNISRCHMDMEHPVSHIDRPDPIHDLRSVHEGFQNLAVAAKQTCSACAWQAWCAGGCPLLTYRTYGRSDLPSPYCSIYQAALPEILRLEGLRILKWGQTLLPE